MNIILKYCNYYLFAKSKKGHGIHSPFVFDFVRNVLNDKNQYEDYFQIEKIRDSLLQNKTFIDVSDYGAGSKKTTSSKRQISGIIRNSSQKKKYAWLLYRIVRYYKPEKILELGTSVGITTLYLAKANNQGKVITVEGCPALSDIACKNFLDSNANNIVLINEKFESYLKKIKDDDKFDIIYIDGNHKKKPTLEYFYSLINHVHDKSICIFDDIYWSDEMYEAWQEIINSKKIVASIDLFKLGLVFFDKSITPGKYMIRY
ncbi:MAG: class I SAM-dependent methyltransferase [Marinilabiliales bacterium]